VTGEVPCEQLVWGWAKQTFTNVGAGYGPIARSRGWPWREDETGGLGNDVAYLRADAPTLLTNHALPRSILVRRKEGGTLAVLKTPGSLDRFGRPTWLVYALFDRTGRVTIHDAISILRPVGHDEIGRLAVPLKGDLPQALLPVRPPPEALAPAPPVREISSDDRTFWCLLTTAVLLYLRGPRTSPVVVEVTSSAVAEHVVAGLLQVLPASLAAQLDVCTFDVEPGTASVDVCCGVTPFSSLSEDAGGLTIRANGTITFPGQAEVAATAEALVASALGEGERPHERVSSAEELTTWEPRIAPSRRPPVELTPVEVLRLLRGEDGRTWLRREGAVAAVAATLSATGPTADAATAELVSLLKHDADLHRELAGELGRRAVASAVYRTDVYRNGRDHLAQVAAVLFRDGNRGLCRAIVAEATEVMEREEDILLDVGGVAALVVEHAGDLTHEQRRRWLTLPQVRARVGQAWEPMLESAVTDGVLLGTHLGLLAVALAHHKARVREIVKRLVLEGRLTDERVVELTESTALEDFEALVASLIDAGVDAGVILYRVLGDERLRPEPFRSDVLLPLLHDHWPTLARRTRLPDAVAVSLIPDRTRRERP
jgi:hypothetical protein